MHTLQQLASGELSGITRLKLSENLISFPEEIFTLADTLEILDLSQNQLSALPDHFGRLTKLRIVFFSDNAFTVFPEVLSQCVHLDIIGFKANKIAYLSETALPHNTRWLILTNNCLKAIPASIGQCTRMQKLMLAGNQLEQLPDTLSNCRNLGLLRISANNIQNLPAWLWSMPKLSWLAFSGNPCQSSAIAANTLTTIPWQQLELIQQLGEGASGIISKAVWKKDSDDDTIQEVAVKLFKGEVTSDGMPADEMDACSAAGRHPNIINVLGKISGHPASKQGLVLELIPPAFTNLGGPPSFATCTRDTFAQGTAFSISKIIHIGLGIAMAAAHLHEHGIMHGDLYAHNILSNEEDHPLLSDFGAATTYDRADPTLAVALERLEVSAFGCLLDDLMQHLSSETAETPVVDKLIRLQEDCMNITVTERPDFRHIIYELTQIQNSINSFTS